MTIKLGIVMDPISAINIKKDTSFARKAATATETDHDTSARATGTAFRTENGSNSARDAEPKVRSSRRKEDERYWW